MTRPPVATAPRRGKRVVAVFAHPDDETFGPGGTFARCAHEGAEMVLVCGTRGEAGSIGHSRSYGSELLGRIRQAELEAAAEVLGFRRVLILGYGDGRVASVDPERGIVAVLAVLQEVEPDVVIAFHPSGISGHPDHKAMTAFATAAVERLRGEAASGPADFRRRLRLHYYTIPASVARQVQFRQLPLVPDEDITVELDTSAYAEVKRRAIFSHKTQLPFYERLTSLPGPDGRFAVERYVTHGAARRMQPGTDLFALEDAAASEPSDPAEG